MAEVYRVERPGWADGFELHVCKTDRALVGYARGIFKARGWDDPPAGWPGTRGLVKPEDAPRFGLPFAYAFLSEESLTEEVVSHEALHVAMAHERFVLRFGMAYGPGTESLEDEERLAHYLGRCTESIWETLEGGGHAAPRRKGK